MANDTGGGEQKGAGGEVEVRAFSFLSRLWQERDWSQPLMVRWERPAPARQLAIKLELPLEQVEAVFINGRAHGLDDTVAPGDRVAFVPPGTPGPYRVLLGLIRRQEERS